MPTKQTVVRAYTIPVQPDQTTLSLINDYHETAKIALQEILSAQKFDKNARRHLRNKLLKNWKYSKHYVDAAINQMLALAESYRKKKKLGMRTKPPSLKKKLIYVKSTLFSYKNGIVKISILPRKHYFQINLNQYDYLKPFLHDVDAGAARLGGMFLFPDKLVITFVKEVKYYEPAGWISIDLNLTNITMLSGLTVFRIDTRNLYHIHRVYLFYK